MHSNRIIISNGCGPQTKTGCLDNFANHNNYHQQLLLPVFPYCHFHCSLHPMMQSYSYYLCQLSAPFYVGREKSCLVAQPLTLSTMMGAAAYILQCTSHNRALRDCGSTVNTTIYPKGYAQSKCVYSNDARW